MYSSIKLGTDAPSPPPPQLEFDHTVGFEKIPFTDILGPSTGTTRYFGWHVTEINQHVLVTR